MTEETDEAIERIDQASPGWGDALVESTTGNGRAGGR